MINTEKLSKELIEAGVSTHGNCNSDGVVWDDDNNENQDLKDVAAILAAHDPAPDDKTTLREEYAKVGVSPQEMMYALWKKVMQSDPDDADDLQSKIDQMKNSIG